MKDSVDKQLFSLRDARFEGLSKYQSTETKYRNPEEYFNGRAFPYPSPYTSGAHNRSTGVMILLQDWASDKMLKDLEAPRRDAIYKVGRDSKVKTNEHLDSLLTRHFKLSISDVYVTNVFPYVKMGGASASILQCDYDNAFNDYCKMEIEIVKPQIVLCCGSQVYWTVYKNMLIHHKTRSQIQLGDSFEANNVTYFYSFHPSPIRWNRLSESERSKNWGCAVDKYKSLGNIE